MSVAELVQRVQEVCPLPATASRVAELARDENTPIARIAEVIATDPALAAQLMRLANSAAFGRPRGVSELEQAVLLIGLDGIQRMAAAMAMLVAFHTKNELSFHFHDRAVLAGSIARVLGSKLPDVDPNVAFLCGLLSEIGAMACAAIDTEEYHRICEAATDLEDREARETVRYGGTSRQIGAELLRRNSLPELVAKAVESDPTAPHATSLERLTGFVRRAADAVRTSRGNKDVLAVALDSIRTTTALPLPLDQLLDACIRAATAALSALRQNR